MHRTLFFFFSSRRRHTRLQGDWSSDVCSSDLIVSLAETDDLTGIWNKRFFRRQLPQEIERARTYNIPLSLMLFDIDEDRKSTRLNSSHLVISYAVFCLKKKKRTMI